MGHNHRLFLRLIDGYVRLHYIPLSASYKEVYNVHAFFSGAPQSALEISGSATLGFPNYQRRSVEGDRRLRRIARAGKQWKNTMGRAVDMEGLSLLVCNCTLPLTLLY